MVTHLHPFPYQTGGPSYKTTVREQCLKTADAKFGGDTLRGETKERWKELCERAAVEQDPERFVATIQELLQALEDREERRRNVRVLRVPLDRKLVT